MLDQLDRDGQSLTQAFNWDRHLDRGMNELIGITRGVLVDGSFVIDEAKSLLDWNETSRSAAIFSARSSMMHSEKRLRTMK